MIQDKLIAAGRRFLPRAWFERFASPIEVHNVVVIPSSVERVWALLTDVEGWPGWYRACRWVRVDPIARVPAGKGEQRPFTFRWKARPVALHSTVVSARRPKMFCFVADARGLHAERTFTIRPTPDGLGTVVVSHETQVGFLAWLGRRFLTPRLRAANQAMFDDLAQAACRGVTTMAALTPA